MTGRDSALAPIDGRSRRLFLLAGGLFVVFAASTGVRTFTAAVVPVVHDVFGPAGFFVGVLGLLGLYPTLADRTPTLARAAAAAAVVPLVGWFAIAAIGVGDAAGVLPDASIVLPGVAFVAVFLTTILAYGLFGAASLRGAVPSRTVGVLLLAPAALILALILGMGVVPAAGWIEFIIDAGHALSHLAIGFALGAAGVPTDPPAPAPESTP